MVADLKVEKRLNSLPSTLTPDTLYMVLVGTTVTMYMSNSTGTAANVVGGSGGGSVLEIEPFLLMGAVNG